jgi:hypothetical protein
LSAQPASFIRKVFDLDAEPVDLPIPKQGPTRLRNRGQNALLKRALWARFQNDENIDVRGLKDERDDV